MEKCRYKIGILNLRDCNADATAQCSNCARPVCARHGKEREYKGGFMCLECSLDLDKGKKSAGKEDASASGDESLAMRRREIYQNSGYHHPFYFGASGLYGGDDYRAFEAGSAPKGGQGEADDFLSGPDGEEGGPRRGKKIKESEFQDS